MLAFVYMHDKIMWHWPKGNKLKFFSTHVLTKATEDLVNWIFSVVVKNNNKIIVKISM